MSAVNTELQKTRKPAGVLIRLVRICAWLGAVLFGGIAAVLFYRTLFTAGFAALCLGLAWSVLALLADNFRLRGELEEILAGTKEKPEKSEK